MFDDEDTVDELPAPPRVDIPPADRELLELAARAIGATRTEEVDGEGYLNLHLADGTVVHAWNPLIHSDDALALAVAVGFEEISFFPNAIEPSVTVNDVSLCVNEAYGTDALAATRRAIVRAAAEVGKRME